MGRYNREKVYEYARRWAYSRNSKYYNYDMIGGDCTNFASQCIYSGLQQMNYRKDNGWYYVDANNRSFSWTGVEFLWKFLINNKGDGPNGMLVDIREIEVGDLIQLSFKNNIYSHSLIVVESGLDESNVLVAAHTFDAFGKKLNEYKFNEYRCIHIY